MPDLSLRREWSDIFTQQLRSAPFRWQNQNGKNNVPKALWFQMRCEWSDL